MSTFSPHLVGIAAAAETAHAQPNDDRVVLAKFPPETVSVPG